MGHGVRIGRLWNKVSGTWGKIDRFRNRISGPCVFLQVEGRWAVAASNLTLYGHVCPNKDISHVGLGAHPTPP